jgi:hypothetical protein
MQQCSDMTSCKLCNGLEKRYSFDPRLAFDFAPDELYASAYLQGCQYCLVILEGLQQSGTFYSGVFQKDVRRVYARCCDERQGHFDTLSVEMYFVDERPKLQLKFYTKTPERKLIVSHFPSLLGFC